MFGFLYLKEEFNIFASGYKIDRETFFNDIDFLIQLSTRKQKRLFHKRCFFKICFDSGFDFWSR